MKKFLNWFRILLFVALVIGLVYFLIDYLVINETSLKKITQGVNKNTDSIQAHTIRVSGTVIVRSLTGGDTCGCDINYNGLSITYNKRWKCYLVNIWHVEREYLCYNTNLGWHFTFPEIEAPVRFKTLCEAERAYQFKYLNDAHEEDLKTVKGYSPATGYNY